jgi:hypothetical protein
MEKVQAVWGVVRHALTFAGGALIALGVVDQVDWTSALTNLDTIAGAGVAVVGVIASIIVKVKSFNWKNIFSSGSGA